MEFRGPGGQGARPAYLLWGNVCRAPDSGRLAQVRVGLGSARWCRQLEEGAWGVSDASASGGCPGTASASGLLSGTSSLSWLATFLLI